MWPRWLAPRFSIRTLLLLVAAVAVGLWSYLYLPGILHNRQDRLSRAAIDPYELSVAGNGDPSQAPPELVAILGDSRLKHWGGVSDVSFLSPTMLYSQGRDEMVRIWDVTSGKRQQVVPVRAATVSGDGAKLFFVHAEGRGDVAEIWSTANWKRDKLLDLKQGRACVALMANKDGSRLVTSFANDRQDLDVQVWDVSKASLLREFKHEYGGRSSCLDDAGQRLALYDGKLLRVFDIATGEMLGTAGPFVTDAGRAHLWRCMFLPTADTQIVTGDAAGEVVIWDYTTGEVLTRLHSTLGSVELLAFDRLYGMIFLGAQGQALRFHRYRDSWRMWEDVAPDAARGTMISDVDRGGDTIAFACSNHSIVLGENGKQVIPSGGKKADVTRLAFEPLGRFVATAATNGEISLWTMRSWRHIRTWAAANEKLDHLEFASDGSVLVSLARHTMSVWDLETGTEQRQIRPRGFARYFAISPDGQYVAAAQMLPSAPYTITLWKLADGTVFKSISHPQAYLRGQLTFASSGDTLVLGSNKSALAVFDVASAKFVAALGPQTMDDVPVAAHPDGKRVFVQPRYGTIDVWDLPAQKIVASAAVHAPKTRVNSIAIHPDGKWAASAANDGTACLWDVETGALVKSWQLGPPKGIVFQVAFSPDGRYLATVNGNGTAYILRLERVVSGEW